MFQRHPNFVGVITVTLIIHINNDKKTAYPRQNHRIEWNIPSRSEAKTHGSAGIWVHALLFTSRALYLLPLTLPTGLTTRIDESGIFLQPTKLKNGFLGCSFYCFRDMAGGDMDSIKTLPMFGEDIDLEMKVNTQALNFPFYPSIKIIEKHIKSTKGEVSDWKNCRL